MAKKRSVKTESAPIDVEALLAETAAEAVDRSPSAPDAIATSGETLSWAKDIHAVSCWIGDRPTRQKAGSQFRFAMWKYANESTDAFMSTVLPRAMSILDRHMAKSVDNDDLVRHEEKAVAELERILKATVHEAITTGA